MSLHGKKSLFVAPAILVSLAGCEGLYAASFPDYNRCPPGMHDAWSSDKGAGRHACLDAQHRAQGPVRAWSGNAGTGRYAMVLDGNYKDGVPVGVWSEWNDGVHRETTWDARRRRVAVRETTLDGNLVAESRGDGTSEVLVDRGGALLRRGPWIEVVREESGEPDTWEVSYVEGVKSGYAVRMDPHGRVIEDGDFKAGERDGVWTVVDPETNHAEVSRYEKGLLVTEPAPKIAAPHPAPRPTPVIAPPADVAPATEVATQTPDAPTVNAVADTDEVHAVETNPRRAKSAPAAPWEGDISFGGRGGGAVNGAAAYVVEGKVYGGKALWPSPGKFPGYAGLGFAATLGQSATAPCNAPCTAAMTGSFGPEARVGFAPMFDNENTDRRAPSVIVFVAVSPSLRIATDVETRASRDVFALRVTAGLSVPYSWQTFHEWGDSKEKIPWFLPNHLEVVYEVTAPTYLGDGGSWGGAGGYSF